MHLMLFLITLGLIRSGYDLFPFSFGRLPLAIPNDPNYLRYLAWMTRDDEPHMIKRGSTDSVDGVEKERSLFMDMMEIYFEDNNKNGNVFTKENLMKMKEVEDLFFNNAEYQRNYCLLNYLDGVSQGCAKPTSVLRYFDGSMQNIDERFYDPTFNNVEGIFYLANTHNSTKGRLQYHLGVNFEITPPFARSVITRARIVVGWPLEGFINSTTDEDAQLKKVKEFMVAHFQDDATRLFGEGVGDMDFFFSSIALLQSMIQTTVFKDLALSGGSMIFIILFIIFQTTSFWVALLAVFSIVSSFIGTNLIYRIVLGYRYLGIFHVLAVFIILGIGADDVFVFYDTWKETSHHQYKSLAHRMSNCYRKASLAMLFTSFTTAVAFIVSATSTFVVIYSFGVFAGVLVAVNYLSVIIFFPCVVVTYHIYWEKYKCCCCYIKV